jgi:hypothetical protein
MKLIASIFGAWLVLGALGSLCFALMGVMFKVLYMGFMFGWTAL